MIRQREPNILLLTFLLAPAIFTFAPLIQFFPVGLGLEMLVISCVFTVLLFGISYSVIGYFGLKRVLALGCFIVGIGFLIQAHAHSDFTDQRKKPNSLIYYTDHDSNKSFWVTYDRALDDWTRGYLGDDPAPASDNITSAAGSKYNTPYSFATEAPFKDIDAFEIVAEEDTIVDGEHRVAFGIVPKRDVDRVMVYSDTTNTYTYLTFNGVEAETDETDGRILANTYSRRLVGFEVPKRDTLRICYRTTDTDPHNFTIVEYSYDLLEHPQFTINKRPSHMMPKPFVSTDAIVVKRSFSASDLVIKENDTTAIPNETMLDE